MDFPLATKSGRDPDNPTATAERLVNIVPVAAPMGAGAPFVLNSAGGTRLFASVPVLFGRAITAVEDVLHVVIGGTLYRINESGTASELADVTDDINTALSGHRSKLAITAGGDYYLWDGSSLTLPGSGRLATGDVGSVAFLDQFTLLGELEGREIEWTEVGTPQTRNALYFRTAEARDDKIVRIIEHGSYVWVLKERSTEVWYNTTAGGTGAFKRGQGQVSETGLLGFNLVCRTPGGLFWVGHDGTARFGGQVVSPPVVIRAIQAGTATHAFYYEHRGVPICCIRFSDRPAWCWDASRNPGEGWHERASGVNLGAWDVVGSAYCYGAWHLLSRMGHIYRLGDAPVDVDGPMRRVVVPPKFRSGGEPFTVDLLRLRGQWGRQEMTETAPNWVLEETGRAVKEERGHFVLAAEQHAVTQTDAPGRAWIRISPDGGNTWGPVWPAEMGRRGQYGFRPEWRGLGWYEDEFAVEINMTDVADFPLLSVADAELS